MVFVFSTSHQIAIAEDKNRDAPLMMMPEHHLDNQYPHNWHCALDHDATQIKHSTWKHHDMQSLCVAYCNCSLSTLRYCVEEPLHTTSKTAFPTLQNLQTSNVARMLCGVLMMPQRQKRNLVSFTSGLCYITVAILQSQCCKLAWLNIYLSYVTSK